MTSEEREIIFLPILPLRPIPIACVSAVGYILKITFLIKSYLLVQAVDLMGFSKITIYHQSFYSIKNFHICKHLYYLHIFSLTHFHLSLKKKKSPMTLMGRYYYPISEMRKLRFCNYSDRD